MRKTLILTLIVSLCLTTLLNAQELKVNGTVKDNNGNSVSLAFVQDKKHNTATRTDSTGKFSLVTSPNAKLYVSSTGYKPKEIDVKDKTDIVVILTADKGDNNSTSNSPDPSSSFSNYTAAASGGTLYGSGLSGGGLLPVFKYTEATKGNRYLFKDWVGGYVVSPEDSLYKNPNYGFNYDKISGALLLTQDKKSAIEIDQSRIKSFTLINELTNKPEVFEYVANIDKTHYPLVLASGNKYKIYKLTITKFIKNNYRTDGMTSYGNNYDEYEDENTYYVYNVQTKQLQPLALKKKAIKAAFAS
ncbi:MAG TPA: carboxypeptidase-like regulatory domain-containing protein, partial [Mucilaginibacter sp.]|nr:carboxypeptidase-like regulatory domain-containing protein [Mucilaginibacter sp.]